jgi:hypothetical protein
MFEVDSTDRLPKHSTLVTIRLVKNTTRLDRWEVYKGRESKYGHYRRISEENRLYVHEINLCQLPFGCCLTEGSFMSSKDTNVSKINYCCCQHYLLHMWNEPVLLFIHYHRFTVFKMFPSFLLLKFLLLTSHPPFKYLTPLNQNSS